LKAVVAEGRQEVEDCRHSVGYSVDDNAEPFLLWVWRSVPGRFWGLFSCVKKFQALFPRLWLLRWALHSPSFLAARWFLGRPGFGLGTAWSYEEFARVSLRQQQ
jgi:hypothetical protein